MIFYIDPGVVQLIERALWERQAASLSLATRTNEKTAFSQENAVFLYFYDVFTDLCSHLTTYSFSVISSVFATNSGDISGFSLILLAF